MRRTNLWTKDFVIIFFANFFVALIFYLLMTTLTVYAVEQFNASQSKAGLASSVFIIGALLARLLSGKYIEVIGRKKLLNGSLLLFLGAMLLYFPANHLSLLLLVRFIHGVAFGAASTTMSTAVMGLIPDERRGEGTSYFTLSVTAATALGPFIGLYLAQYADFHNIFIACTVFSLLSLGLALCFKMPSVHIAAEQRQAMKQGFKVNDFIEKKAMPISLVTILVGIAYSGILTFLNAYAFEIHLEEAAGLFFVVYAIILSVSRPLTGKLLDLKGDNMVCYPALLFFSLSLILISQAGHGFMLLLAGALAALGFGTMISCGQAIAVKESPKHRVGLATSTFFICLDGGVGGGAFLAGLLIPFIGFRGMYLLLALLVFLSIFVYYFTHGKKKMLRENTVY